MSFRVCCGEVDEPIFEKGRNVTCDNFFTSLKLAENLKKNGTSLIGTMNRARREVPVVVKNSHSSLYDTQVLRKDDITMTIYQGKLKKKKCYRPQFTSPGCSNWY